MMITVTNTKQVQIKVMWQIPGKMYSGTEANPLPNCEEALLDPGQSMQIDAVNGYDTVEMTPTGGDGGLAPAVGS